MTDQKTPRGERDDLVVVMARQRLTRACVARGWSYAQLARHARVSRPTMTAALRGRPVRPLTAWKIARALSDGPVPTALAELVEDR